MIEYLVVHHSASPLSWTTARLRRLHVEEKGYDDIGYQAVINSSGRYMPGRPYNARGAHARKVNRVSWGVCVIGNNTVERSKWRQVQVDALGDYCERVKYLIPGIRIVPHYDVGNTLCPATDIRALLGGALFR